MALEATENKKRHGESVRPFRKFIRGSEMGSPAGASWKSCIISLGEFPPGRGDLSFVTSHSGRLCAWVALLAFSCHCVFSRGLIAADYQTQSLAGQKSSASSRANCTLWAASSAWTESVHILITGEQHQIGSHAVDFPPTSSRLHSSCISPSICSTNSSVSRIYTRRAACLNVNKKLCTPQRPGIAAYLEPGAVGCIRMLLSGERSFHPRGYESDGCVTVDAFVSEVSAVEQPTPAGDQHSGLGGLVQLFWPREEKGDFLICFCKGKGGKLSRTVAVPQTEGQQCA